MFYEKKSIFITGGTGFLGIAIIEKLLRCCNVNKIYLLIRPKKGKSIEDRLEELKSNEVFERLISEKTNAVFSKLAPIAGDVGSEGLGLSPKDRGEIINEVQIVIHSAATLDFQETLRPTVNINLLGTRRLLELCGELKKLEAVTHVSSAYVNSFLLETEEILYPPPADAEEVIDLVKKSSDSELANLTPKLLGKHPNAYTFTKHLAEHEVKKQSHRFPCGIVRPSMITAAWHEPVPGWTISKNGPQGFLMGASKGVVRRLPVGKDIIYDYIPVDVVVNEILLCAYYVNRNRSSDTAIFHCTSGVVNPFRWNLVADKIDDFLHAYPMRSAVWYPGLKFHSTLLMFKISAIFLHFLPALVLDLVLKLSGKRPILVKLHTRIWTSLNLLSAFIFTEWKFNNKNTMALHSKLSAADQEVFFIDVSSLKWDEYFEDLAKGVLRYLNKENPKYLQQAKNKDKTLFYVHLVFQFVFHVSMWLLVASIAGVSWMKIPFTPVLSYLLFSIL